MDKADSSMTVVTTQSAPAPACIRSAQWSDPFLREYEMRIGSVQAACASSCTLC
jgi:hypothetical protein